MMDGSVGNGGGVHFLVLAADECERTEDLFLFGLTSFGVTVCGC